MFSLLSASLNNLALFSSICLIFLISPLISFKKSAIPENCSAAMDLTSLILLEFCSMHNCSLYKKFKYCVRLDSLQHFFHKKIGKLCELMLPFFLRKEEASAKAPINSECDVTQQNVFNPQSQQIFSDILS